MKRELVQKVLLSDITSIPRLVGFKKVLRATRVSWMLLLRV